MEKPNKYGHRILNRYKAYARLTKTFLLHCPPRQRLEPCQHRSRNRRPQIHPWEWDTKHQNQILRLKQLQLEKFQQRFLPTYEEELSKLTMHLNRLEDALEESLYSQMSPACLLQMALQIRGRLARMRDQVSVHNPEPNELYPRTGCITSNPYDQFADDDLVVDSPQSASDSEKQNRTKPDETRGVENRSLNINGLQQIPKSLRPVLDSQNQMRQAQPTSKGKPKQPS